MIGAKLVNALSASASSEVIHAGVKKGLLTSIGAVSLRLSCLVPEAGELTLKLTHSDPHRPMVSAPTEKPRRRSTRPGAWTRR